MQQRLGTMLVLMLVLMLLVAFVAGCHTMTGQTVGQSIDDSAITTAVKTKLAAERLATLTHVSVETVRGTVYLTGIVPTAHDKRRAEQLAWEVGGVKDVVNNLQLH